MKLLTVSCLVLLSACVHTPDINPSYGCGTADMPNSAIDVQEIGGSFLAEASRNVPQLRRCYEADLIRDTNARGKVRIVMNLDSNGAVKRACISDQDTDYVSDSLHACLLSHVRSWQFSAPLPSTPVAEILSFDPLLPLK